jgi:hypothetical protein
VLWQKNLQIISLATGLYVDMPRAWIMMTNIFKCGREDGKPLVSGNGKTPTQPVRLTGFLR